MHSSLRAIGWCSGGPVAVIAALCDVLGPRGTLVMPTQSGDLSDPATWEDPPVPAHWQPLIRDSMPPFDPAITPTRGMGRIAELFRTWPGVCRSDHPTGSFAAWGHEAAAIAAAPQPLDDPFGRGSPLDVLLDRDASILMLGTSFETCTAFHLAERLVWPDAPTRPDGAPVMRDGVRCWARFRTPIYRTELFETAGLSLEAAGLVQSGQIGNAASRLLPLRGVIDHLVRHWGTPTNTARAEGQPPA